MSKNKQGEMKTWIWLGILTGVFLLLYGSDVYGAEKEEKRNRTPDWKDLDEDTWGPLGRVDNYLPHEACDMCFTMPEYNEYQIYEYVKSSDVPDGAIIIPRMIPNPAPEIKEREDYDPDTGGYYDEEDGEWTWYIGDQGFVGPTDEEKWSPNLPVSTIEMKRIQARHTSRIMGIHGVHGFGIGTEGFVVDLLSRHKDNRKLIPDTLEGIPVEVRLTSGLATFLSEQGVGILED